MCLLLRVRVPASGRSNLKAAMRKVAPADMCVWFSPLLRWPWARGRDAELRVSERGGCACSLLSNDADWDAATWSMKPELLERLARTLFTLAEHGPDGMMVEALWQGEKPEREEKVTARGLADLARNSRLGTHTRYLLFRE
jgi:hypothetical protein